MIKTFSIYLITIGILIMVLMNKTASIKIHETIKFFLHNGDGLKTFLL